MVGGWAAFICFERNKSFGIQGSIESAILLNGTGRSSNLCSRRENVAWIRRIGIRVFFFSFRHHFGYELSSIQSMALLYIL